VQNRVKSRIPKAYYIPWTLLVLLVLAIIFPIVVGGIAGTMTTMLLASLFGSSIGLYLVCILPPVAIYRFLPKRNYSYLIHGGWFVVLTFISLMGFSADSIKPHGSDGSRNQGGFRQIGENEVIRDGDVIITAHDIIHVKFGLAWWTGRGGDAATLLMAATVTAILYWIEKSKKERWREANHEKFLPSLSAASAKDAQQKTGG
jgi:hypothetical protein